MQSETDYNPDGEIEQQEDAYRYFMRVDPAMRDILGDIEEVDDPVTGRRMRRRTARVAMQRGAAGSKMTEVLVYLDPFPHIRQPKGKDLQGWYSGKTDGQQSRMQRDRPCETDAILTQPYGGYCPVGCTFCYINSGVRGYRGSGLMSVPLGYGEQVRRQLRTMQVSAAGYFSSFTDPFLPLEDYYHNTQEGAQAFTDFGLPVFFLSRLHYPGWAFDMLTVNRYSYAQKSINTPDQATWKLISPGAISLADHLDEVRELRRRGVYVSIQCNPIIPGVVSHEQVEELFGMLAEAGANHVIVKFVEANFPWARAMVERIRGKFPDGRGERFEELFTENSCGGQRTIVEEYRREGHRRYQARATALGMTYALCYEYTRLPDGRFVSMGPEFLTADQCHGHRVPMHRRVVGEVTYQPMEVCPPSGCLRCSDKRPEGADSPCDSDVLPQALALRLPQLRQPFKVR